MEVTVTQHPHKESVAILTLKGDFRDEADLKPTMENLYQAGIRYVLMDLSGVPFMSSAGLRAVYNAFVLLKSGDSAEETERVKEGVRTGEYKSPHVKLLRPNKKVMEVLGLSGFDMFLEIYDDLDKALQSF